MKIKIYEIINLLFIFLDIFIWLILMKVDKFSVCGVSGLSYIFWSIEVKNKVEDVKKCFVLLDC